MSGAQDKDKKMSRRDFMKISIASISGFIGAVIGLPAIAYVVGPALQQGVATWIRLGPVSKVEVNNPTLFKTTLEVPTGWIKTQEEISAYVLTENGRDFVAISNICTHLGCRVRWIAADGKYHCPCHNGLFSKDGTVLAGPPPRPLDRFETKVEDGILYIKRG